METLRYVLVANGLLAVVSIAYYALLRRETFFGANRLALWLGLTGALVLPLLKLPDWRPQPVRHLMQRTAEVIVPKVLRPLTAQPEVTITFPNRKTYRAFRTQQQQAGWSWQLGLMALYIAGLFVLSIRFCIQLVSLRKLIRHSIHEPYDDFTLVRNRTITSPFSFFNWVVVNPSQHTSYELDQILRHERVHVRERHSADMIGAELVCLFFWFNPAAYLFRHLLQQTLEFYADRAVLTEGVDAQAYQYNLLKVSLLSNQSAITNHFSKSQLKSRIVMLNRPTSPKTIWLKYPVFFMAALTVASAFARPQHLRTLRKYVPRPITETFSAMVIPAERIAQPISATNQPAGHLLADTVAKRNAVRKLPTQPVEQQPDSAQNLADSDSVRVSPSRYIVYQGDYLYWIVTPKTTFDDFSIMKQEFAKHGHAMQLNEIKYDPLYAYISRINFTVQRPTGGMTRCNDFKEDNKPILSIAGYVGIGTNVGASGTGAIRAYKNDFPEALRKTAVDEEAGTAQFINEHRLEYLLQEGNQKFKELGSGSSTYPKEFFKNKVTRNSGLIVQPDGSLTVDKELGAIRIFINNEPVTRGAVTGWKVNQLYSVVKRTQYNPARKESFPSALLIYTTEEK